MRDQKRPAVVRAVGHVEGPADSRAEIPGDNPLDSRAETQGDNPPDNPAVVHAGQSAGHIEDQVAGPFLDQTHRWRALRPDCLGRGGPRCSMDMPVVVAMLAEVQMTVESLRGLMRRPNSVLESR